tara:strand:- start:151 stop:618 length:468 start_codon:yes stop_codon:yes gene_type:complete
MAYKESESYKQARIEHDYRADRDRWEQGRRDKADTSRSNKNESKRNERSLERDIKDVFKDAINDAQSTKEKRQLKKDRDEAIGRSKERYSPTDPNTTIDDNSTDQTGSNPENGDGGSSDGGSDGGGLPEGFAEETLDVVNANNTAGQRVFLTKAV